MDHISVTTLVQAYKLTTAVDDIGSGNHCNHLGRVPSMATASLGNNGETHSGGPERGLYVVQDSKVARMIWSFSGVSGR